MRGLMIAAALVIAGQAWGQVTPTPSPYPVVLTTELATEAALALRCGFRDQRWLMAALTSVHLGSLAAAKTFPTELHGADPNSYVSGAMAAANNAANVEYEVYGDAACHRISDNGHLVSLDGLVK